MINLLYIFIPISLVIFILYLDFRSSEKWLVYRTFQLRKNNMDLAKMEDRIKKLEEKLYGN